MKKHEKISLSSQNWSIQTKTNKCKQNQSKLNKKIEKKSEKKNSRLSIWNINKVSCQCQCVSISMRWCVKNKIKQNRTIEYPSLLCLPLFCSLLLSFALFCCYYFAYLCLSPLLTSPYCPTWCTLEYYSHLSSSPTRRINQPTSIRLLSCKFCTFLPLSLSACASTATRINKKKKQKQKETTIPLYRTRRICYN